MSQKSEKSATVAKDRAQDPAAAPYSDRPSADTLAAAARAASARGPAPVHLWNPPFCGDLDMRIARDGSWWYQGSPIGRESLVRLFSSILKREGERYYLVTPAEKVGIVVDDAPFVAVDFTFGPAKPRHARAAAGRDDAPRPGHTGGPDNGLGNGRDNDGDSDRDSDFYNDGDGADGARDITFTTQVGDSVTAGPDHPIRVSRDAETGEPSPYVLVRAGLWALIDRKSFYRLIELGEHYRYEGERWFGFRSGGAFFPVIPSTELDDI